MIIYVCTYYDILYNYLQLYLRFFLKFPFLYYYRIIRVFGYPERVWSKLIRIFGVPLYLFIPLKNKKIDTKMKDDHLCRAHFL